MTIQKGRLRGKYKPRSKVPPKVDTERLRQQEEQQALLEEMAGIFVRLEKTPIWSRAMRLHCAAWAAVMSAEIPQDPAVK